VNGTVALVAERIVGHSENATRRIPLDKSSSQHRNTQARRLMGNGALCHIVGKFPYVTVSCSYPRPVESRRPVILSRST
jgi:hypothetical protein